MRLLSDLGRTLRVLPGRKQVIFFTEGFDPRLVRGRDARATADEQDDVLQTMSGNVWRVDTDARYGSSMTMTILDEMARSLRGSDVVLHAVDIQGVRVQNDENGSRINSNDALHLLSRPTGGEVFKNSNDVNADLEKMLRAQNVVYVLGFRAPVSNDGKFHELKVRVTGVPGARVFHRAGYYDSGAQSALERSLSNAEIVLNDIAQSDINVAALAAAFPAKDGKAQVPVVIDIAAAGLLRDAKANDVVAEVYVYAFDDQGVVRDRSYQRLTIDIARMAGRERHQILSDAQPSARQVRAEDARARRRHRAQRIRAHRRRRAVDERRRRCCRRCSSTIPRSGWSSAALAHDDAPYPFHINGEPFMPSASARRQQRSRAPRGAVRLQRRAGRAGVGRVRDRQARSASRRAVVLQRLQGQDVMKLLLDYSPADLLAGPASFDVTVHKKGSSDARKASVPLVVQ